jgi:hypothetical protein
MLHYKLPEPLYSWAWSAEYLAKVEPEPTTPGGLLLPRSAAPEPAFCHFSQLRDGGEFSWLWFFPDPRQATALRLMQTMPVQDSLAELVQLTIPRELPDCHRPTYLQLVDQRYLGDLPLREMGIDEIWIGFDHARYANDRSPRAATELVLTAEDFCQVARR